MPEDLRAAHDENDEVLERIYIGRRFRNDTERLEKLFDLYTKMTGRRSRSKEKGKKAHDGERMTDKRTIPSVSLTTARTGASTKAECTRHARRCSSAPMRGAGSNIC